MSVENFFDYLKTVEIDLNEFNNDEDIVYTNIQPIQVELQSLYAFMEFKDLTNMFELCDDYNVGDNDRVDQISQKLYGTFDFWWVNLLVNNISVFDLPLNEDALNEFADYLYQNEYKYNRSTYFKLLQEQNDKRRKIKVVKEEYLYVFLRELYSYVTEGES